MVVPKSPICPSGAIVMETFPYSLDESAVPTFGLVVLQADETIENDFRQLLPNESLKLYVTRIPSGDAVTPETLTAMENDLTQAASLLPPAASFDVVGYGCTSGTAAIGAERIEKLVRQGVTTAKVTNPLSAAKAAFDYHGIRRLGIVSPYIQEVSVPIISAIQSDGVDVVDMLSFGEETEASVARIDKGSVIAAARALAERSQIDGLFLSCTNLRTLEAIKVLEAELRIPILSSNQTLAWHMKTLAQR